MTVTFYKNMSNGKSQYYSLHDRQGDLFTPHVLTAVWGKDLNSGRVKVYTFSSGEEMDRKLRKLFEQRIKLGFKVLYSFARSKRYRELFRNIEKAATG
ncbi:MAG: hypothetical protein JW874_01995 [Spirochaetales bacterium]|nr:hypothetical protein [Spirochaetales bacterium]